MELDRLSVDLRRRNGWETLDLGLIMMRAWRKPVWRAWCFTYWPFALLVSAIFWTLPGVALLIVWWSKPLFDRILLFVYSRAVFGTLPSMQEVWRELPHLLRRTRLPAALTFYRFSMARSLFLPVWQLEGQRGKPAAARRRVLGRRAYGYAAWLTFFCANFVSILFLGTLILGLMLLPEGVFSDFSLFAWLGSDTSSLTLSRSFNLIVFAAETVVEPYFVAAGFSLYLNRRSELEGWDIEVAFRRMAERHARNAGFPALSAGALVLALGLLGTPLDAHATEAGAELSAPSAPPATSGAISTPGAVAYPPGEMGRRVKAIMNDPVFGQKETAWRWVYRDTSEADTKDRPAWLRDFLKWLGRVIAGIAEGGRVLMWIAIAVALAAAVYLLVRYRERLGLVRTKRETPDMVFGLDVRPQSLPADIRAAARALLERGEVVAALSLLYRGALSALIHFAAVQFRPGDTESDCWRRAGPVMTSEGLEYFRGLLDAWLWTAYGHRPPEATRLQELCERWPDYFAQVVFAREEG